MDHQSTLYLNYMFLNFKGQRNINAKCTANITCMYFAGKATELWHAWA